MDSDPSDSQLIVRILRTEKKRIFFNLILIGLTLLIILVDFKLSSRSGLLTFLKHYASRNIKFYLLLFIFFNLLFGTWYIFEGSYYKKNKEIYPDDKVGKVFRTLLITSIIILIVRTAPLMR